MNDDMFKDFPIAQISRVDLRLMGIDNVENITEAQMKGIASVIHHKLTDNNFLHKCIEEAVKEVINK